MKCTDLSRRQLLTRASMLGAVAVGGTVPLLAATGGSPQAASDVPTSSDIDILNFLLNLKYLQAEFYTKATTGLTLAELGVPISGVGNAGPTTGGQAVQLTFADDPRDIAVQIARDEQRHVRVLRTLLGANAIAKPEINLDALGLVSSLKLFMWRARQLEDLGLSAYDGVASLFESKAALGTATRIALVEGQHTGYMRFFAFIAGFGSPIIDSHDVLPPTSGTNFFSGDNLSLAVVRTSSEVLAFLYHNNTSGTMSGGYFPQGVNGTINTV
jgi:Ferritin-like domain